METNATLELLERHPLTKELKAQEAAGILSKRQAAAAKIKDLTLDLEATRIIKNDIDDLNKKMAVLDSQREKIKDAIRNKYSFYMNEQNGIESDINQQRGILYRTYDAAIDDAIQFFLDKHEYLRKPQRISTRHMGSQKNIFAETVTQIIESNYPAVVKALDYCMAAIKELEEMKLIPALDITKIEALKNGIPAIDIYSESQTEKPYSGLKPVNPLDTIPSDELHQFTMDRLLEKAKKILRQ